jgi:hypothetical protein
MDGWMNEAYMFVATNLQLKKNVRIKMIQQLFNKYVM